MRLPLLLILLLGASAAHAVSPSFLEVQGRMQNAGGPVTGTFAFTASLYAEESGSPVVWSEATQTAAVEDGVFSLTLGLDPMAPLTPPIFAGSASLWLGIRLDSGPGITTPIELPRQRVGWTAYAFHAEDARSVDGHVASQTPQAGALLVLDGNARVPMTAIDSSAVSGLARLACYDTLGELSLAASSWDQLAADDLTVNTLFGGDVTGTSGAIQIVGGVVGTDELADGAVTLNKLAPGLLSASNVAYDAATSGLPAANTQAAIDVLAQRPSNPVTLDLFPTKWSATRPGPPSGNVAPNVWYPVGRDVQFLKTQDETTLLVTYSDSLRVGEGCGTQSTTYVEIRMDGGYLTPRCYQRKLDAMTGATNKNYHSHYQTVCVVENVPKGLHRFDAWVYATDCGTAYVGWEETQPMILVQELPTDGSVAYTTVGAESGEYTGDWKQVAGRTLTTTKASSTSLLRLTLADTFRSGYACNGGHGELEIRMDGAQLPKRCSFGKYDNATGTTGNDHHGPAVLQCIAENVPAGVHTFTVWTRSQACGSVYVGWQRTYPLLMAEELAAGSLDYYNGAEAVGNVTGGYAAAAGRLVTHTVKAGKKVLITYSDTLRTGYFCSGGYGHLQVRADGQPLPEPCQFGQYQAVGGATGLDHHWPFHLSCVTGGLAPGPHTFQVYWIAEGCGSLYLGWNRGQSLLSVQDLP